MLSDGKALPSVTKTVDEDDYSNTKLLDLYSLEFLDLPSEFSEVDLRKTIIKNLKNFILEIGKSFTFVGVEYRVQVGNEDFFIDLLFYNRDLSCLVAFELKVGKFKPEYVSKMDFYLEALDRQERKENENYKDRKSIVIYFSRTDENYSVGFIDKGNTEVTAEYISEITNADMFKVEPKIPYSKDYNTCIEEAKERQANHNAPIIGEIPDLAEYEVIYIGAPVYWEDMPEELVTALKTKDFSGKTIRPFTTHEGSGLGNIPNQIKRVCNGAKVAEGLAIRGTSVTTTKNKVEDWI